MRERRKRTEAQMSSGSDMCTSVYYRYNRISVVIVVTHDDKHVGLTGGLASGKSFVGHALADLGCFLIEADALGRQVLEQGGETYDHVVAAFGKEILDPDGKINRKRLAAIVFSDQPDSQQRLAWEEPMNSSARAPSWWAMFIPWKWLASPALIRPCREVSAP